MHNTRTTIYVDSDSNDGSSEVARSLGVDVVELDASQPLSAARARNAGFDQLMNVEPDARFVQFIDGDCELIECWIEKAVNELNTKRDVAVVAGRLHERDRNRTVYNRLCDME